MYIDPSRTRPARFKAQDGRMALHDAAMKGAPFEVIKLLLQASPEAVTAADKARTSSV